MLAENVKPFFLPFCTVSIPTSKNIWMQLRCQIKCYQKHGSFKIVEVCERLFNLLPALCDTITLIYVEQPFGFLYIKQRVCVF